jgi:hypothetical protein
MSTNTTDRETQTLMASTIIQCSDSRAQFCFVVTLLVHKYMLQRRAQHLTPYLHEVLVVTKDRYTFLRASPPICPVTVPPAHLLSIQVEETSCLGVE